MLKSDLKTQLATELDDPSNTDLLTLLGDYIDESVQAMAIKFKFNILNITLEETLLIGTNVLELDGIIDIVKIQRKDNRIPIPRKSQSELIEYAVDFEETGPPYYWFEKSFNQTTQAYVIQFNQLADTNYDLLILAKKEIGSLADNVHIPFPVDTLHLTKNYVRSLFYVREELAQKASMYKGLYNEGISDYLRTHGELSATRTRSPRNSDLHFGRGSDGYDINLDPDRIIVE